MAPCFNWSWQATALHTLYQFGSGTCVYVRFLWWWHPQVCGNMQEGNYVSTFLYVFCWPCTLLWFLVNDQLDAQFFSIYLFQFATCFEQSRVHHQENQLYQYNLWYMSLCVGDRFVYRSERNYTRNGHRHKVTYIRGLIDTIDSPDDEHRVARNM